MAWILITPSSRGIGAALTRHLLQHTNPSIPIVATTRSSDPKSTRDTLLSDLNLNDSKSQSRLDVQKCDLLSESSISDLASYCKDRYQKSPTDKSNPTHLRTSFLLPGQLHPEKSPSQIDYDKALETLKLNLLAPMMLIKYFSPFLPKKAVKLPAVDGLPPAAVMAVMSARVGSITDNGLGGWYSYRASKAGVNQLVKTTDNFVKMQSQGNACVVALHPGTVKTGLSKEFWGNVKEEKLFSPEFAAGKLVDVVSRTVGEDVGGKRGRCWDWKGEEVPP